MLACALVFRFPGSVHFWCGVATNTSLLQAHTRGYRILLQNMSRRKREGWGAQIRFWPPPRHPPQEAPPTPEPPHPPPPRPPRAPLKKHAGSFPATSKLQTPRQTMGNPPGERASVRGRVNAVKKLSRRKVLFFFKYKYIHTYMYIYIYICGCGSKLKSLGYAGFGPCFHLPGFRFGTGLLSHSHTHVVCVCVCVCFFWFPGARGGDVWLGMSIIWSLGHQNSLGIHVQQSLFRFPETIHSRLPT